MNVVMTIGRSVGGPIGGLLADSIGWRWSFASQAPLLIIAIIIVYLYLPKTTKKTTGFGTENIDSKGRLKRIDFVGSALLAATIVLLLGALSLAGESLTIADPIILGSVGGSVALGVMFVVWEVKFAREPVFPPRLLIQRDVVTPYAIVALLLGAQYGVSVLLL
jgi:MFS family permease